MKLLIVIDMQNDFIDGALGNKEAMAIVNNVADKIASYKNRGMPVVFTRDTHQNNYLDTLEGKNLPIEHCIQNTKGWEINTTLNVKGSKIVDKPAFGSLKLAEVIYQYIFEEIEIIGLCTDICVISNAIILKSTFPDVPITVDASCCAGVTPVSHKNALEAMKMCQINIINEEN